MSFPVFCQSLCFSGVLLYHRQQGDELEYLVRDSEDERPGVQRRVVFGREVFHRAEEPESLISAAFDCSAVDIAVTSDCYACIGPAYGALDIVEELDRCAVIIGITVERAVLRDVAAGT